jgi:hypothetical protein
LCLGNLHHQRTYVVVGGCFDADVVDLEEHRDRGQQADVADGCVVGRLDSTRREVPSTAQECRVRQNVGRSACDR